MASVAPPQVTTTPTGVFMGGHRTLRRLQALLGAASPRVLFLHGLAGSGKSTLVRQFATREAESVDTEVVVLDCREIEPTEHGFVTALADAVGASAGEASNGVDVTAAFGRLAPRVVLCLDHYEVHRLLDTWIRQHLVPALPANVGLLLTGREAPNPAWSRLPAGNFEVMQTKPLGLEDSTALLRALGVDEGDAAEIVRFAGGHPLTLVLAALAAQERPLEQVRAVTMGRLLDEFTRAYLEDLDEDDQDLLEAAAVVRRVSIPLLEAMLPAVDARRGFEALRGQPFVDETRDGLALHSVLQESIAARLRAASPLWHRDLRRRAWSHLREQLRSAPAAELWRHTADMVYLLENPAIREAMFPSTAHRYAIEPAVSNDADAIRAIIERHEPTESAELLGTWWSRRADAFRVARDPQGEVVGFSIITTVSLTDLRRFAYDPVAEMWLKHQRSDPIAPGQDALLLRRWLTRDEGDAPCEAQAALWLDLKRMYMDLRPRLRRIYSATDHPDIYGPALRRLEAQEVGKGGVTIGGRRYHAFCLDFGPSSVDGWLTRIAAQEMGIHDTGLLDVPRRQLVLNGRRVDLTPKEFEVMGFLNERVGDAVARTELLAAIWGYDQAMGSNVVDAVIHNLRKKLGSFADTLETVRGVGYRLTSTRRDPPGGGDPLKSNLWSRDPTGPGGLEGPVGERASPGG